jgi:hypothetical protein
VSVSSLTNLAAVDPRSTAAKKLMAALRGNLGAVALSALGLLGVGLTLYLTRDGAGAGGDSAWYIMGAQNLSAGNGFSRLSGGGEVRPITGFPPFFSVVLSGLVALQLDLFSGARLLSALLFGATIILAGLMILKASGSGWAAVIGAGLVLASSSLIEIYSWIMSEPLYIVLSLLSLHLLSAGISGRKRWPFVFGGLLVAGSVLTRYVGFSMLAAGVLCILVLGSGGRRWRLVNVALFGLLAALPAVAWLWAGPSAGGTLANRQVIFHSMNPDLVDAYKGELVAWVFAKQLPIPWIPRALLAVVTAGVGPIYFVVSSLRRGRLRPVVKSYNEALNWLLISYLFAFFGVLAANSLFLDAATTLGAPSRYLAPALVALIILSTGTTAELARRPGFGHIVRAFAPILGALLLTIHIRQSLELLIGPGLDLGYVGVRRDTPEVAEGVRGIGEGRLIISNNPELVFILAERPAYLLPFRQDPYSQQPRSDYELSIRATRRQLEDGAVLVIFGSPDEQALEAMEDLNVTPMAGFGSTMFYGAAP